MCASYASARALNRLNRDVRLHGLSATMYDRSVRELMLHDFVALRCANPLSPLEMHSTVGPLPAPEAAHARENVRSRDGFRTPDRDVSEVVGAS